MTTKTCYKCNKSKTIDSFSKEKRSKDGLHCWCINCLRKYNRNYTRQWRKNNPDKTKEAELKRKRNPSYFSNNRKNNIKIRHSITLEQYEQMLVKQNGVCAICGNPEMVENQYRQISLSIDHNHKTGKIRGLLCIKCNTLLGRIEGNLDLIPKFFEYLKND
jgi:hypothetical protein